MAALMNYLNSCLLLLERFPCYELLYILYILVHTESSLLEMASKSFTFE